MKFTNKLLDDLCKAIYGKENNTKINYKEQNINYNENGDTYFYINTYTNNEVESIMVCAKEINKNTKTKSLAYIKIYIKNNDFNMATEYIIENLNKIELDLDKKMKGSV